MPSPTEYVEITVKFLAEEYRDNREVYTQRINYEWVLNNRPMLVQEVIAVFNGLVLPSEKKDAAQ
jgi:hypothetical protein